MTGTRESCSLALSSCSFHFSWTLCCSYANFSGLDFWSLSAITWICSLITLSQKRTESTLFPGLLRSTQMQTVVSKMLSSVRQVESMLDIILPPPSSYTFTVTFLSSFVLTVYLKSKAVVSGRSSLGFSSKNFCMRDVFPHRFSPKKTNDLEFDVVSKQNRCRRFLTNLLGQLLGGNRPEVFVCWCLLRCH